MWDIQVNYSGSHGDRKRQIRFDSVEEKRTKEYHEPCMEEEDPRRENENDLSDCKRSLRRDAICKISMDNTLSYLDLPSSHLSSPSVAKGQCARVPSAFSLTCRDLGVSASLRTPSSSLTSMHSGLHFTLSITFFSYSPIKLCPESQLLCPC